MSKMTRVYFGGVTPSPSDATEGSSAVCVEGLRTDLGRISRGGSAVLPGGLLTTAALGERSCGPITFDTSAAGCYGLSLAPNCSDGPSSRVDDGEEDAPNFKTLPRAAWMLSKAAGTLRLALLFFLAKNSARA